MRVIFFKRVLLLSGMFALLGTEASRAQLNNVFNGVFREILDHRLSLSPGVHGGHFLDQADLASSLLTPALNGLIVSNVSAFPISSATVATLTFNIDSGRPASSTESLGPILAEIAETLGKNKVNLEINYTYLNLAKFRGLPTQDIRFTFTHEDVTNDGALGESPNESDTIDLLPGFDVDAQVMAAIATWGWRIIWTSALQFRLSTFACAEALPQSSTALLSKVWARPIIISVRMPPIRYCKPRYPTTRAPRAWAILP